MDRTETREQLAVYELALFIGFYKSYISAIDLRNYIIDGSLSHEKMQV